MSSTADQRIVADGLGVLVPTPDYLASCIYDLGFFPIVSNTRFDPVLGFFSFPTAQEVNWSCIDVKDPFSLSMPNRGGDGLGKQTYTRT